MEYKLMTIRWKYLNNCVHLDEQVRASAWHLL